MRISSQSGADTGAIRGPAAQPHQVRTLDLRVEALPGGGLRVSTPSARGWAAVARNRVELEAAVSAAFTEAQCAAYARWRGERYDLDQLTDPVPGDPLAPPRRAPRRRTQAAGEGWGRNQRRPDTHRPEDWTSTHDGGWMSPGGNKYAPHTQMAQRITARRRAAGLDAGVAKPPPGG